MFLANQCTVTPSRSVSKEPREGAVKSECGRLFFFFRYQERGKAGKGRRTCFMNCFIPRVAFAGLPVCLICSVLFNVRFTFDCFFGFYFLPLPLSSYSVPFILNVLFISWFTSLSARAVFGYFIILVLYLLSLLLVHLASMLPFYLLTFSILITFTNLNMCNALFYC